MKKLILTLATVFIILLTSCSSDSQVDDTPPVDFGMQSFHEAFRQRVILNVNGVVGQTQSSHTVDYNKQTGVLTVSIETPQGGVDTETYQVLDRVDADIVVEDLYHLGDSQYLRLVKTPDFIFMYSVNPDWSESEGGTQVQFLEKINF